MPQELFFSAGRLQAEDKYRGIKEKILAAKRAGVTTIVISEDNRKDIEDIKPIYVEGLTFQYVRTIGNVMEQIFT